MTNWDASICINLHRPKAPSFRLWLGVSLEMLAGSWAVCEMWLPWRPSIASSGRGAKGMPGGLSRWQGLALCPYLVLATLGAGVVAKFWALLRDFADLGVPRKGWDGVSAGYPFLRVGREWTPYQH